MDHADGRLNFRPTPSPSSSAAAARRGPLEDRALEPGPLEPGDRALGLTDGRDGVLYVPETAGSGAPVLVFLHGAGGTGRRELRAVIGAADRFGTVIAAPDSRGITWDVLQGGFGPDVAFIDRMMASLSDTLDVDLSSPAIGGISDGASYALSVGVVNGGLFDAVIAFSPGFVAAPSTEGRPRIFVSHGTDDPILPIDVTSRRVVPMLQAEGYDVTYREFDGGHTVPAAIAEAGFAWWVAGRTR